MALDDKKELKGPEEQIYVMLYTSISILSAVGPSDLLQCGISADYVPRIREKLSPAVDHHDLTGRASDAALQVP